MSLNDTKILWMDNLPKIKENVIERKRNGKNNIITTEHNIKHTKFSKK